MALLGVAEEEGSPEVLSWRLPYYPEGNPFPLQCEGVAGDYARQWVQSLSHPCDWFRFRAPRNRPSADFECRTGHPTRPVSSREGVPGAST